MVAGPAPTKGAMLSLSQINILSGTIQDLSYWSSRNRNGINIPSPPISLKINSRISGRCSRMSFTNSSQGFSSRIESAVILYNCAFIKIECSNDVAMTVVQKG